MPPINLPPDEFGFLISLGHALSRSIVNRTAALWSIAIRDCQRSDAARVAAVVAGLAGMLTVAVPMGVGYE